MPTVTASHFILDLPTLLRGDVLRHRDRRSVAAVRLSAKPQHAGAGALGHRIPGWRRRRGVAGGAARHCPTLGRSAPPMRCSAAPTPSCGAAREASRAGVSISRSWPRVRRSGSSAFQFDGFAQSMTARVGLVSAITATYALLAACELWYARDRDLISRWPTLILVVGHAGFLLARIPFAQSLAALGRQRSGAERGRDGDGIRSAVRRLLPAVPARRHVEGARRARAAQSGADRFADRRRQSPRVLRSRRPAAGMGRGRAPAGRTAAVRSRSFQGDQRHRRSSGRRPRAAGILRSGRRLDPARRSVRPAGRRGIRLSADGRVDGAGAAHRRAVAARFRGHQLPEPGRSIRP